jgi:hypothetical protein
MIRYVRVGAQAEKRGDKLESVQGILAEFDPWCKIAYQKPDRRATQRILEDPR